MLYELKFSAHIAYDAVIYNLFQAFSERLELIVYYCVLFIIIIIYFKTYLHKSVKLYLFEHHARLFKNFYILVV